jgi:hypothetical protein
MTSPAPVGGSRGPAALSSGVPMSHSFDDLAYQDFTSRLMPDQRLRITMAPCRVGFTGFGVEKALTPQ